MADAKALLERSAQGDVDAWDQLVEDHQRMVWQTAREGGLSVRHAASVFQAVWLRLVENLEDATDDLPGWLVTVARDETSRILSTPRWKLGLAWFAELPLGVRSTVGGALPVIAGSLTSFAVVLAGKRRTTLREEWRSHLAGDGDDALAGGRRLRAAAGFVVAAARLRLQDVRDLVWRPVDRVLRSRALSNIVVWVPTTVAARTVIGREGFSGLVFFAHELVAVAGAFFGLIRLGRWWRGVCPAAPSTETNHAKAAVAIEAGPDDLFQAAAPIRTGSARPNEASSLWELLDRLPQDEQAVLRLKATMPKGRDDLVAKSLAVPVDEVALLYASAMRHLREIAGPGSDPPR